jgi:hypothetical protein
MRATHVQATVYVKQPCQTYVLASFAQELQDKSAYLSAAYKLAVYETRKVRSSLGEANVMGRGVTVQAWSHSTSPRNCFTRSLFGVAAGAEAHPQRTRPQGPQGGMQATWAAAGQDLSCQPDGSPGDCGGHGEVPACEVVARLPSSS